MTITDLTTEALRRGRLGRSWLGLRWWVYAGAFVLGLLVGWVLGR